MLVLSRQRNQSIRIAQDIIVTVVEIRGSHVRLGIVAPKEIAVHREEVFDEIQAERAAKLTATEQAVANVAPTVEERAKRKGRAG